MERTRLKAAYVLTPAFFLLCTLAFANVDRDAAAVFAVLFPASAAFLLLGVWNKHLTFTLFAMLFVVANGIGPAFFFLQRELYAYSGWGAVGDFEFYAANFFPVALAAFKVMTMIALVCLLTSAVAYRTTLPYVLGGAQLSGARTRIGRRASTPRTSLALLGFIVFIAVPLSLFMFSKGIGLVGVENATRLPFRLGGILYYVRYFLIPILIFHLYSKSSRPVYLVPAVLGYAAVAGICSVSRSLLMLSAIAVPVFAFLDRKYLRLVISALLILSMFSIVTAARDFAYSFQALDLNMLVRVSGVPTLTTVATIASRLGGAQENVLAYQYNFQNPLQGVMNFFLARPVLENYALELYGFELPEGMAFGVGFPVIPSLVMLAGRSFPLTVIAGAIVGALLVMCEKLVRMYLSLRVPYLALLGYPLAFLLASSLFAANFRALYFFVIVSAIGLIGFRLVNPAPRGLTQAK